MKIGIFSGSFNPIHTGHLIIANYLCEFEKLDEIWFVVSPQNPLKSKRDLLSDIHRITMVKKAIRGNRKFKYCDIEFSLPLPSYTVRTLKTLKEKYPENEFHLIIIASKNSLNGKNIQIAKSPIIEISSTFIREGISKGKNMNYYMPSNVYRYILSKALYQPQT